MSAEILRRAAALMRERAEAADSAPWTQDSSVRGDTVIFNASGHWVTNVTSGRTYAEQVVTFDHEERNGEHIASWHPAVALAVADLLDDLAETEERNHREMGFSPIDIGRHLAVARAYLGESA